MLTLSLDKPGAKPAPKLQLALNKGASFKVTVAWKCDARHEDDVDIHALEARNDGGGGAKVTALEQILSTYNTTRMSPKTGVLVAAADGSFATPSGGLRHSGDIRVQGNTEAIVIDGSRLPAGINEIPLFATVHKAGHGQELVVAFGPSITGLTLQVGVQVQVLLHAQVLVQPEALRHVADIGLHGQGFADCVDGEHPQAAPVRGEQAGAEPHEGGFAGAVRADQAGDPVGADGAADPVQGGQPLLTHREGFDQILDYQGRRGLQLRPGRRGRGFGHEPGCGSGPQGEAGTDSGGAPGCRVTVTGMPRRSSCWGSQTKMRAR